MKNVKRSLEEIKAKGLFRRLRRVSSPQDPEFVLDGKRAINFSSNNTLGLATHPALAEAARDGLRRYGVGSGASRLISGHMAPHEELERALASFIGCESTLVFPSGYHANIGAIPALTGESHVILSDELNHASLIDGIRLSRAEHRIYPHNLVPALKQCLQEIPKDKDIMVVTESIFSMEGDRAPLDEIASLKNIRPFLLYVDEAHALGATGPGGRGIASALGCNAQVDFLLGTLGKAFGVAGAFLASQREGIDLLINQARSFIYTTALPPFVATAAHAALKEVENGKSLREKLKRNTAYFRGKVSSFLGSDPPGQDHIIPVFIPGRERVMEVSKALLDRDIYCQGIRPPTVPLGKCRLRFSITAQHTREHLDRAAKALEQVLVALPEEAKD